MEDTWKKAASPTTASHVLYRAYSWRDYSHLNVRIAMA
jgi:hypothetical protein